MKKRHIYIATLFIALLSFSACNDEWKDELYVHMVSLKAPINDGEVSSIYVRYKPNGEVIYNLPVLVSGSTPLDKDLDVRIAVELRISFRHLPYSGRFKKGTIPYQV